MMTPFFKVRAPTVRLLVTCSLIFLANLTYANPQGGTVVGGNATISQNGNTTLIHQGSQSAAINWNSFNIGTNELTRFLQPSSSSIALNRIIGNNASSIFGRLTANGRIILVNPSGILFMPGSRVDVAGLIATTANINTNDFMNGNYRFNESSTQPGKTVINRGTIHVSDAGLVALVAPGVENSGVIEARLGKITLASGNTFTVDLNGDQLVNLAVTNPVTHRAIGPDGRPVRDTVVNRGKIIADGGNVTLTAQAAAGVVDNVINNTGIIEARSIGMHNGQIVLGGGNYGNVYVRGKLNVSGRKHRQTGGKIAITGENIKVAQGALLDASGNNGGGSILIGGDYQGKGSTTHAKTTTVETGVFINADAINYGNGGKVIVWSDNHTQSAGNFSAKGGALSGNGGLIETSGKTLDVTGTHANASAPAGKAGSWLLDPTDVTIDTTLANTISSTLNGGTSVIITTDSGVAGSGNINMLNGANISLTTGTTNVNLTLNAANSITLASGSSITNSSTAGTLLNVFLNAGQSQTLRNSSFASNININSGANITTLGGSLNLANAAGNITVGGTLSTHGANGANGSPDGSGPTLAADGLPGMNGGNVNITLNGGALTLANNIDMTGGNGGAGGNATITTQPAGNGGAGGNGGALTVTGANTVTLSPGAIITTNGGSGGVGGNNTHDIQGAGGDGGNGGNINITAKNINVTTAILNQNGGAGNNAGTTTGTPADPVGGGGNGGNAGNTTFTTLNGGSLIASGLTINANGGVGGQGGVVPDPVILASAGDGGNGGDGGVFKINATGLVNLTTTTLNVNGGNGNLGGTNNSTATSAGNAGQGGAGGDAGTVAFTLNGGALSTSGLTLTANGGNGGTGGNSNASISQTGDGGDAGKGGNFTISSNNSLGFDTATINLNGGTGGTAGSSSAGGAMATGGLGGMGGNLTFSANSISLSNSSISQQGGIGGSVGTNPGNANYGKNGGISLFNATNSISLTDSFINVSGGMGGSGVPTVSTIKTAGGDGGNGGTVTFNSNTLSIFNTDLGTSQSAITANGGSGGPGFTTGATGTAGAIKLQANNIDLVRQDVNNQFNFTNYIFSNKANTAAPNSLSIAQGLGITTSTFSPTLSQFVGNSIDGMNYQLRSFAGKIIIDDATNLINSAPAPVNLTNATFGTHTSIG